MAVLEKFGIADEATSRLDEVVVELTPEQAKWLEEDPARAQAHEALVSAFNSALQAWYDLDPQFHDLWDCQ